MAHPHPHSPATTISSLSHDDQRSILDYIPSDCKVLAVAPARIYHSSFGAASDDWTSTGLRGMLVFGRNRITVYPDRPLGVGQGASFEQNYWFRLVDLEASKGIVWFHPIPQDLDYYADKPFFHTFSGASRMFGFRFDEDHDAEKFRKRVTSRIQITESRTGKPRSQPVTYSPPPQGGSPPPAYSLPLTEPEVEHQSPAQQRRKLSPGMISSPAPGTFVHVAHVGLDKKGRLESSPNIEPGWTMIMDELQGYGVTETMVEKDFKFVEGFLAGAKASLIQELHKTTAAAKDRRPPTESAQKTRSPRRKNIPAYF